MDIPHLAARRPAARHLAALALMLAWLAGPLGPAGCASPTDEMIVGAEQVNDLGYTYRWAKDLAMPDDQRIGDVRVLGDLIVLIEQPGNTVWALALRDGQLRWSRVVGILNQPLYASIRWDEMVHINSPTRLYSLAETDGSVVNISELDSTVTTGPVLYEDFAIFGAANGRVFAHNLNTGYYRWVYQMRGQIRTPPIVDNWRAFVTDDQGGYAMLNADDGSLLWRRYTWGPIRAEPGIDDQNVYVASEDRSLYALDLRSAGRDRWVYHAERPLTRSPGVTDQLVLVPEGSQGLLALNKDDGSERWRLDTPAELVHQRADGRLLLASNNRLLLADAETGDILAEATTHRLHSVLPGPDEGIILVSANGRMLRLNRMR